MAKKPFDWFNAAGGAPVFSDPRDALALTHAELGNRLDESRRIGNRIGRSMGFGPGEDEEDGSPFRKARSVQEAMQMAGQPKADPYDFGELAVERKRQPADFAGMEELGGLAPDRRRLMPTLAEYEEDNGPLQLPPDRRRFMPTLAEYQADNVGPMSKFQRQEQEAAGKLATGMGQLEPDEQANFANAATPQEKAGVLFRGMDRAGLIESKPDGGNRISNAIMQRGTGAPGGLGTAIAAAEWSKRNGRPVSDFYTEALPEQRAERGAFVPRYDPSQGPNAPQNLIMRMKEGSPEAAAKLEYLLENPTLARAMMGGGLPHEVADRQQAFENEMQRAQLYEGQRRFDRLHPEQNRAAEDLKRRASAGDPEAIAKLTELAKNPIMAGILGIATPAEKSLIDRARNGDPEALETIQSNPALRAMYGVAEVQTPEAKAQAAEREDLQKFREYVRSGFGPEEAGRMVNAERGDLGRAPKDWSPYYARTKEEKAEAKGQRNNAKTAARQKIAEAAQRGEDISGQVLEEYNLHLEILGEKPLSPEEVQPARPTYTKDTKGTKAALEAGGIEDFGAAFDDAVSEAINAEHGKAGFLNRGILTKIGSHLSYRDDPQFLTAASSEIAENIMRQYPDADRAAVWRAVKQKVNSMGGSAR